ncbi:hypothetical protein N1851_033948 [Merluccius polli]|uniref:Uncharacterized protein n=1 Tax=Merluccius polli TaxID=89951 RepID=A0AA47M0E9_MERPO|nr:hypothetical protein N1851_033948 [Merluccius polli]
MYALATATLLLNTIGVYGAAKDKTLPLIIVSTRLLEFVKQQHLLNWLTPLDTTNGTDLEVLHEIQHVLRCCGVEKGYQDWGSHIHKTCICTEDVTECIAAPFNNGLYENNTSQTIMIYKPFSSLLLAIMILVRLRRKVDVPPVYYSAEAKAGNYASLGENEIE